MQKIILINFNEIKISIHLGCAEYLNTFTNCMVTLEYNSPETPLLNDERRESLMGRYNPANGIFL